MGFILHYCYFLLFKRFSFCMSRKWRNKRRSYSKECPFGYLGLILMGFCRFRCFDLRQEEQVLVKCLAMALG